MKKVFRPLPLALLCIVTLFSCRPDQLYGDVEESKPPILLRVNSRSTENVGGYYLGLPFNYTNNANKKNYPLIISLHGAGALGYDSSKLDIVLSYGAAKFLKKREIPSFFTKGDTRFSFITVSPQFQEEPTNLQIKRYINFVVTKYRIDVSRIYLLGSSVGGRMATDYAAEYPEEIAAVVAMSGISGNNVADKCQRIFNANMPVWIFHNIEDPAWPLVSATNFVSILNSFEPLIRPKFTILPAPGHDSWETAADPVYKENGMNIYEWLLEFKR